MNDHFERASARADALAGRLADDGIKPEIMADAAHMAQPFESATIS